MNSQWIVDWVIGAKQNVAAKRKILDNLKLHNQSANSSQAAITWFRQLGKRERSIFDSIGKKLPLVFKTILKKIILFCSKNIKA